MTLSLFSLHWHRVARLRPRLRASVRVQRREWRGQRSYLLTDDATGRQYAINEPAYQFIGRCDGRHDVQGVWDAVLERFGDAAPTQDEVVQLLVQLDERELLQCERTPDTETLFRRHEERTGRRRRAMLNPFAFRLPLGDPSRWLEKFDGVAAVLFGPAAFGVWAALVAAALFAAAAHWSELRAQGIPELLSGRYLMLAWLAYPVIKALHELAHALAVRRWGGEVREIGIALLVLVPAPYVDASAASVFPRRAQRAAVAAAGIMVETALAAIALFAWLNLQPGLARDMAFVVMLIGSVSTVLFNGNPLLRFDGYYILCDLLDLPNLAARSNACWSHLLRRHVLRATSDATPAGAGERKWLLVYAPASFAYRVAISIVIVLWFGAKWFLLGVLAALYVAAAVLAWPVLNWMRQALASAAPGAELARVRAGMAALAVLPGALLFAVPVPSASVAPAVVWLPEQAQVRPEVDGFVAALPVADGARVQPGDLLIRLDNPDLRAARAATANRLAGLEAQQYLMLLRDPLAARNLAEQVARTGAELERLDERIDRLEVRAKVAGRLVMPRQSDLLGTFSRQGQNLGYVLEADALRVRAAVPEADAFVVRTRTRRVDLRLAERPGEVFGAIMSRDEPAATHLLPSPALGDRSGGPFATDLGDKDGRRSVAPLFLFDLDVPTAALQQVGGRAWVRFDHGFEPLGMQGYRRASQLFLKHFDPHG